MTSTIALLAATIGMTAAAPPSPEWHSDYGKALQQTRSDERPLLMVIDHPADSSARITPALLKTENGEGLHSYDLCHVDASTEYGKEVAKVFKTEKLPYVAVIDKTGSVILHSQSGDVSSEEWNNMLSKYEKGERRPLRRIAAKPVSAVRQVMQQDYFQQASPRPYCAKCQRGY